MSPNFQEQAGVMLGQSRPSGTSTETLVNTLDKSKFIVYTIYIANNTSSAADFSIYHDNDGTTYDQSTALYYEVSLAGNTTEKIEIRRGLPVVDGATIGIKSGTGDALTFTIYGVELAASGGGF